VTFFSDIPNSGRGLPRLPYREEWDVDFMEYLKGLDKVKPVILCGDLNVAHEEIGRFFGIHTIRYSILCYVICFIVVLRFPSCGFKSVLDCCVSTLDKLLTSFVFEEVLISYLGC